MKICESFSLDPTTSQNFGDCINLWHKLYSDQAQQSDVSKNAQECDELEQFSDPQRLVLMTWYDYLYPVCKMDLLMYADLKR